MATHTATRATLAGFAAALAIATLGGCSANPVKDGAQNAADKAEEKAVENAGEKAVENAGENGGEGDVNLDIGTDVAVPADFPADLPLPGGTLVASVAMSEGWQLNYNIDDGAVAKDIVAQYAADDAYEETVNSDMGGIQAWTYTSDTYSVTIGLIADDPTSQMTYLVVPISN